MGQWNPDPGLGSNPDRPQEASDFLRTTHDHSSTKRRLNHDCDRIQHRSCLGHTHRVSDWSETASDFLGLITDFLRQLWPIFVFVLHRGPGIDLGLRTELLGLIQSRPSIKSPRKSQTTQDCVNLGLWRSQEV